MMKNVFSAVLVLLLLVNSTVVAQETSSVYDLSQINTTEDSSDEMLKQVKALVGNMAGPVATKDRAIAIIKQVNKALKSINMIFVGTLCTVKSSLFRLR